MAAISASTLLDEAKCYLCYGVTMAQALELALLSRISQNSGGSPVVNWGDIQGTLALQLDLNTALTLRPQTLRFSKNTDTSVVGAGAFETLATFTIPGGSMGANGMLRMTSYWTLNNNANSKFIAVTLGGATVVDANLISTVSYQAIHHTVNRNSQSAQVVNALSTATSVGITTLSIATTAVDTSVDQTLIFKGFKAVGGDTLTLRMCQVEVNYMV